MPGTIVRPEPKWTQAPIAVPVQAGALGRASGPFGCTSVPECMERFREVPETYWRLAGEGCEEND